MEYQYTIKKTETSYSKKKGSFQRTRIIASKLTQDGYNEFMSKHYPNLVLKEVGKDKLEGTISGLLYPGKIAVKRTLVKPK